jgi:hypothetical protein
MRSVSLTSDLIDRTCDEMGWDSQKMWKQLSNEVSPWWKHSDNESYIYYNRGDGQVGFKC